MRAPNSNNRGDNRVQEVSEITQGLKALAKELGVFDRVTFLGNQSHEELPKILHASDAFIRPSITEGLGNAFLEAMAVGLPTIGTRVGGIPDFLHEGETGLFCKVRDHISIADAVAKYVKNPELYKTIQDKGQKIVLEKYSWNKIASQMDRVFKNM